MAEPKPSFFVRLGLAFSVFLRLLYDPEFAASVLRVRRGDRAPSPQAREETPAPLVEPMPDSALQLLGLLQQEGRLVDFLEEEIAGFSDPEIGAAARVVHDGCRKALHEHLTLEPVRQEQEGARVTLEAGFDASSVRITGNVVGDPPFTGTLIHRGWRSTDVRLPKIARGHDVGVLAPAEVEL